MQARRRSTRPAAWTVAARHAGIVVGLLLLTPIFTAGLDDVRAPVERAGLAHVLDAPLSLESKIAVARRLDAAIARGRRRAAAGHRRGASRAPTSTPASGARSRRCATTSTTSSTAARPTPSAGSFLAAALLALLAAGRRARRDGRRARRARLAAVLERQHGRAARGRAARRGDPGGAARRRLRGARRRRLRPARRRRPVRAARPPAGRRAHPARGARDARRRRLRAGASRARTSCARCWHTAAVPPASRRTSSPTRSPPASTGPATRRR